MRRLIKQGVFAGLAGGAVLALVLRLVGEGPLGRAVAAEATSGDEMFGRGVQQVGGMAATLVYGAALGAVFAIAYALVRHRLQSADDWRASVGLAAAAFAGVYLLPFLKYPANPPTVGDPATIGRRTALYLVAVAWSLVATWAGWRAWRAAIGARRWPVEKAAPAAVAVWVVLAALGLALLPPNPDPVNAPATLIWQFRLASAAGAAAFWSVVGMAFGWLRVREAADARVDLHDRA